MKKYLVMMMLVASSLSMVAVEADAKRLGGGGSFGRQSQGVSRSVPASPGAPMQQAAPRPVTPPAAGAAATAANAAAPWGVPADFDVPAFLRHAKSYFLRLQDAWDKGDVNDIREFTNPEMFAELRMQIEERGAALNVTDVVQLNAELLGIESANHDYLASVKFSGLIKEAPDASAAEFAEVWNLSKPKSGQGGWVLAGIQQLSLS